MELSNCLNPSILQRKPFIDKIFLSNYGVIVGPNYLETTLRKYPQIRDFYNNPPYLATIFCFDDFIAKSINFTLVSDSDIKPNCNVDAFKGKPRIHNLIWGHQLQVFYNESMSGLADKPAAAQRYTQAFSFRIVTFHEENFILYRL